MELGMIACDTMLQVLKQKIANCLDVNNAAQFGDMKHLGRMMVKTFKAARDSALFLNVDDNLLPAELVILILQKKLIMYNVMEIALTAIESIGLFINTIEDLQNAAVQLMHAINEL